MWFFTADWHLFHYNIIHYDNRPFSSTEEMHECLVSNHNEVVKPNDRVIFVGDFSFAGKDRTEEVIAKLNGKHTFLKGDHDSWLGNSKLYAWERNIEGYHIFAIHWQMRVWPRSHYNSWNIYANAHGKSKPIGKQIDVGVMNNNYYPFSFEQIFNIMLCNREDNFNLIQNYKHI